MFTQRNDISRCLSFVLLLCLLLPVSISIGQNDGDWVMTSETGSRKMIRTKSLNLHPAAEPRPALKHRLIPGSFQQVDGNAAIYYLRAMGFVEQSNAQKMMFQWHDKAMQETRDKRINLSDVPPYSWQGMSPRQLPIDEVRAYLQLTEFQNRDIAVASKMRTFTLDRNIRNVESPISILLPEVQQMRGLARTQSLRCRLAVAEGRFDDAIQILGQQFAMANHLSQDPFLVSNLVGVAIAGIAWGDALEIVQMSNATNLYWALATMPKPLVPLQDAFSYEYEFFNLEVKALAEVDEQLRPAGYWMTFVDRILPQYQALINGFGGTRKPFAKFDRLTLVNMIAAGYPGAKRYLVESEGMDEKLVESYPTAQVFFLAQKRFYEQARDELFKWNYLEQSQILFNPSYRDSDRRANELVSQVGFAAGFPNMLLPATHQVLDASNRCDTLVAALQAIEGIRMYAAMNDNALPLELSQLPYPLPDNPFTGKPFDYKVEGETATLTVETKLIDYRLNLQIAK